MKLVLAFIILMILSAVGADKDTKDSNLSMVLVKALQGQLKTCMDQNRDLVQRSCQKPRQLGGNGDHPKKRRAFAFHAELRKGITNLPPNHKVVFDKIHLNEGGAYDPKSGIFTCKEPGIYVFDWTITTDPNKKFHTHLVVDGVIHGRLFLQAASQYRAGSSMVVVRLKAGSKVWVKPYGTGQIAQNALSFFSGFKI